MDGEAVGLITTVWRWTEQNFLDLDKSLQNSRKLPWIEELLMSLSSL